MKKTITILLATIGIMSCGNTPKQVENLKDKAWQEPVSGLFNDNYGALGG